MVADTEYPTSFRIAFALMMVATAVDATDGWLARAVRVDEVLPGFDGRQLDNLIDFQTYTSLPLLLIWRAGVLPGAWGWLLLVPLLASAYGFSQVNAKTEDGYFLGFPSYWNVVALYLYVLRAPLVASVPLILVLSILTFVPTRYLYASKGGPYARIVNVGAAVWFVSLAMMLSDAFGYGRMAGGISLIYPLLYMGLSFMVTVRAEA